MATKIPNDTVTTQRTSKVLKVQLVISVFLFWYGPVLFFISGQINFSTMVIGGVWYVIIKLLIWWQHK